MSRVLLNDLNLAAEPDSESSDGSVSGADSVSKSSANSDVLNIAGSSDEEASDGNGGEDDGSVSSTEFWLPYRKKYDRERYTEANPPSYLDEVFASKEERIDEYIKRHPDFRKGLIENPRHVAWLNVLLWDHPRAVHAILRQDNGASRVWMGRVWTSPGGLEEIELMDDFVKYLVNPRVLESMNQVWDHYADRGYITLHKYARQSTIDETKWRTVIYCAEPRDPFYRGCFQLRDCYGGSAAVDEEWVDKNLQPGTLQDAKDHPDEVRWIELGDSIKPSPPLTDSIKSSPPLFVDMSLLRLPSVKYRNSRGRPRCMIKSLASALHHMGYAEEAANLVVNYEKLPSSRCRTGELARLQASVASSIEKKPLVKGKYDLSGLVCSPSKNPIVACLKAACLEDGRKKKNVGLNHCVCFWDTYVFDSNYATALEINKENLDRICNDIVDGSFYDGIYWSRVLLLHR